MSVEIKKKKNLIKVLEVKKVKVKNSVHLDGRKNWEVKLKKILTKLKLKYQPLL